MSDAEEGTKGKGKKGKGDDDAPKGKSNLVPAIIIAVGLVLGGKMMGGGGGAAPAAAAAPAHAEEEELDCEAKDLEKPPKEGAVIKLDSQVINLADGKYIKVAVALQLSSAENAELFEEEGLGAKASNEVIAILTGRSGAELTTPEVRAEVQEELTASIRPLFECNVLDVLLTEFVVQ